MTWTFGKRGADGRQDGVYRDLSRHMSRAARRHHPARLCLRRLRLVVRQHRSDGPARMRDISRNYSPGSISSAIRRGT